MWVIYLEAALALLMLLFIVWWTMFHGRTPARPPGSAKSNVGSDGDDAPRGR